MKRTPYLVGLLTLLTVGFSAHAAEMKTAPASFATLLPGATLQMEIPELPAVLNASLPANYKADGQYPLFVYLSANGKSADMARAAVGPNDYICVGLPLLNSRDGAVANYRTMLQKLHERVPNIASKGNVLGGFSGGAEWIGEWLAARDPFILEQFQQFFLYEGGFGPLRAAGLPPDGAQPRRYLLFKGDSPLELSTDGIEASAKVASIQLTSVVLRSFDGNTEEARYLSLIGQWARGTKLPPRIIAPSRPELLARFAARQFTDSGGHSLGYRLFVPKNYDPSRHYPLTVFLHGSGESGNNNESQLANFGPGVFSDPLNQQKYPSFVIAPQCPRGQNWGFYGSPSWAGGAVIELVGALQAEFSLDPDRLYITGLSLGGIGTWSAITQQPHLFAAAVPVAGAGDPSKVAAFKSMPVWAFHGSLDHNVPIRGPMRRLTDIMGDADMIEALQKAGGTPKFTIYEGEGHGIWALAYNEPGLLDWLFSQSKTHS